MKRLFDQHDFAPSKDKLVGPSKSAVFLYYNELIPLIQRRFWINIGRWSLYNIE